MNLDAETLHVLRDMREVRIRTEKRPKLRAVQSDKLNESSRHARETPLRCIVIIRPEVRTRPLVDCPVLKKLLTFQRAVARTLGGS